jgi:hypothetical protein
MLAEFIVAAPLQEVEREPEPEPYTEEELAFLVLADVVADIQTLASLSLSRV